MPVFKFRVAWEEEDNIYRDIALVSGQTFLAFQEAILKAFEFDNKHAGVFYESNDKLVKGRAIDSEVLVNKKDAPALAMVKTPVSALVDAPNKKFIYVYDKVKQWTFIIDLIGIEKEESIKITYPHCFRKEGLAPSQTGIIKGLQSDKLVELEDKYDLNSEDMDEQGFSNDDNFGGDNDSDSEGMDSNDSLDF